MGPCHLTHRDTFGRFSSSLHVPLGNAGPWPPPQHLVRGPKPPRRPLPSRMPHTRPGTQCPQGTSPLAGTLSLFKLCGPHSPRRALQTGFPQWDGDITVSSRLTFPHSDIIFHTNRKYQGATLLVLLGSNTNRGSVSGPSPQVLLGRFYALSTQPCVCLPASTCTSISAAGMMTSSPH